jgi:hypothetical protein
VNSFLTGGDVEDFLFSYRLFATADEVVPALVTRFRTTDDKGVAMRYAMLRGVIFLFFSFSFISSFTLFYWNGKVALLVCFIKPIRIFNVFRRWIEKFWSDFSAEPNNATKVLEFVETILNSEVYSSMLREVRHPILFVCLFLKYFLSLLLVILCI